METTQPIPQTALQNLIDNVLSHSEDRSMMLNLIASENAMSPLTRQMLASDLGNRYSYGPLGKKAFAGTQRMDEIEGIAASFVKKLFRATYANVQPISGMVANLVAFSAVLRPGDTVLSCSVKHGGHYSHAPGGMLDLFQAQVHALPFNPVTYQLDLEKAEIMIKKYRPRLVIVGASEMLFPIPLEELRAVCDTTGTIILYDAAHVAGLIAGNNFQQPLAEGAHLLTTSTNKTLAGPDHGFVASRYPELFQSKIEYGIAPLFVSNNHPHHIAGLAMTLIEMEEFGAAYAKQVVANAQALGKALTRFGLTCVAASAGFTKSHTIVLQANETASVAMRKLEEAGIITSPCPLPSDNEGKETGIRIGTNEMTRYGMKEGEMGAIAELIADVLLDRKTTVTVRQAVREFRASYQIIRYCFASL